MGNDYRAWLHNAPSIRDLVSEREDCRGRKNKTAIIIPTSNNRKMLSEHLRILDKQDSEFDIIIVYGKNDGFVKAGSRGILHVRERQGLGCAGAFFIGQRIALDEGYEYILLADDDCFPVSENLVSENVRKLEEGADLVLPARMDYGGVHRTSGVVNHYAGFRRSLLEKEGLTFLPFYMGGEDLEMLDRVRQGKGRIEKSETSAYHPYFVPMHLQRESRLYHYQRGMLEYRFIRHGPISAFRFIAFNLTISLMFFIIGERTRSHLLLASMWAGSGFEFFGKKIENSSLKEEAGQFDFEIGRRRTPESAGKRMFLDFLRKLPSYFGKRVLLSDSSRFQAFGDLLIAIVAGRSYAKSAGKVYRFGAVRSGLAIVLGIVLLLLALPAIIPISAALALRGLIIKTLSGIETRGYGTRKKD